MKHLAWSLAALLAACAADPEAPVDNRELAIVGGEPAATGQFPSLVSVRDEHGHYCGGTLIAPHWVLTAGHCAEVGFRGGATEVVANSLARSHGGEHLPVFRAYRHPNYDEGERFPSNDVALLRLRADSVQPPVRLATPEDMVWVWRGAPLQVAGWGTDAEDGESLADNLQYTELPLVSERECRRVYGKYLPNDTLCAGFKQGGHDSCYGDSGGPLLATVSGRQLQVGVVSAGEACAQDDWYGLYARVASFSDWIANTIAQAEADVEQLGTCVAACDAMPPCEDPDSEWSCWQAKNTCLCACANDDSDVCLAKVSL